MEDVTLTIFSMGSVFIFLFLLFAFAILAAKTSIKWETEGES